MTLGTHLVEVDGLVEALAAVLGQVGEALPLLVDVVDALLDLLRAEVARLDEVAAHVEHVVEMAVSRTQLVLVRLRDTSES